MNRPKSGCRHMRYAHGLACKDVSVCCLMVWMAMMCMLALAGNAQAAESTISDAAAGTRQSGSITLEYLYRGASVEGANVKLYRVADWNGKGSFSLDSAFSGVRYDWDGLMKELDASQSGGSISASDFQTAATTLEAYAQVQGIAPVRAGTVYVSGAAFNGLDNGLYLISIGRYADAQKVCGSSASLVALPYDDGGNLVSQVTVHAKNDCEPAPVSPAATTLSVGQVWKDDDERTRPASVTVALLRDCVVVDDATLSAANGWRHTWADLDAGHDWTAVERTVPKGYTVAIDRDADTLTITNSGSGATAANGGMARTGAALAPLAIAMVAAALVALPIAIGVRRRR